MFYPKTFCLIFGNWHHYCITQLMQFYIYMHMLHLDSKYNNNEVNLKQKYYKSSWTEHFPGISDLDPVKLTLGIKLMNYIFFISCMQAI